MIILKDVQNIGYAIRDQTDIAKLQIPSDGKLFFRKEKALSPELIPIEETSFQRLKGGGIKLTNMKFLRNHGTTTISLVAKNSLSETIFETSQFQLLQSKKKKDLDSSSENTEESEENEKFGQLPQVKISLFQSFKKALMIKEDEDAIFPEINQSQTLSIWYRIPKKSWRCGDPKKIVLNRNRTITINSLQAFQKEDRVVLRLGGEVSLVLNGVVRTTPVVFLPEGSFRDQAKLQQQVYETKADQNMGSVKIHEWTPLKKAKNERCESPEVKREDNSFFSEGELLPMPSDHLFVDHLDYNHFFQGPPHLNLPTPQLPPPQQHNFLPHQNLLPQMFQSLPPLNPQSQSSSYQSLPPSSSAFQHGHQHSSSSSLPQSVFRLLPHSLQLQYLMHPPHRHSNPLFDNEISGQPIFSDHFESPYPASSQSHPIHNSSQNPATAASQSHSSFYPSLPSYYQSYSPYQAHSQAHVPSHAYSSHQNFQNRSSRPQNNSSSFQSFLIPNDVTANPNMSGDHSFEETREK